MNPELDTLQLVAIIMGPVFHFRCREWIDLERGWLMDWPCLLMSPILRAQWSGHSDAECNTSACLSFSL